MDEIPEQESEVAIPVEDTSASSAVGSEAATTEDQAGESAEKSVTRTPAAKKKPAARKSVPAKTKPATKKPAAKKSDKPAAVKKPAAKKPAAKKSDKPAAVKKTAAKRPAAKKSDKPAAVLAKVEPTAEAQQSDVEQTPDDAVADAPERVAATATGEMAAEDVGIGPAPVAVDGEKAADEVGEEPIDAEAIAAAAAAAEAAEVAARVAKPAKDARYYATGKRKTSVARVILTAGDGSFWINGRSLDAYFPRQALRIQVMEPLMLTGAIGNYHVRVRLHGGGISSQAGALRHGLSRALAEIDPVVRTQLKGKGYLKLDARQVERKKAGLKKARKRPQFSKR